MTDSGFDTMINSRLNRSFSDIFKGPLLPHFGSKAAEEPLTEEQIMEKRLAKHLPKSRSSRKQKTIKSKTKSVPNLDPLEDHSSRTLDTSPHSSSSSIDHDSMDDSDNKRSQKDATQTIRRAESKKVKSSRQASPRQASGKPKLRRTKSLEGTMLMVPERKHQTPKTRGKKMSDRSSSNITKSPTRRSTDLRKSVSAKDMATAAALNAKKLRRNTTKSGVSSKPKAERRSPLREYSAELLRSHSPHAQTKERRGSAKSSSKERRESSHKKKERRDMNESNHSDSTPPQPKSSPAQTTIEPTTTALSTCNSTVAPVCVHVGHWTCDCGSVLRDRMNFCGMCGTPKHWTCESCHFTENLCRFVFCGDCGVPRAGSDSRRSADSFPGVVSIYDKVEED